MTTRSSRRMRWSDHRSTKASARRTQLLALSVLGVLALLASACAPPEPGTPNLRPVAVASADVNSGTAPLVVSFSSDGSQDSDGSIVSYGWSFGDGGTSNEPNPTHTYTNGGVYLATLTVTDNLGLTGTSTVTVTVGAGSNQSPVAVIASATPSSGKAPLSVSFSSAGSADPDGSIVSYRWDWGDGTAFGTTANPSHTFTTAGTFVVKLTVTDNFGATGSTTTTVSTTANLAPQAAAEVSSPVGIAPATLSFSSANSADPDGIIVARRWNFGDGSPINTNANPTHTFTSPGNYVVTLTVIDDNGASDTSSLNISVLTVNQAPVAVPKATPQLGKAPLQVQFDSTASSDPDGTIVAWEWDFGDGNTSTEPNPTHVYADPGTYTATLKVTDDRSFPAPLTATASITIEATEFNVPPTAVASVDPETGKVPLPVQFSSEGSFDPDGGIASYEWEFGDGNTSDEANPTHVYTAPGEYTATLTVTDVDGAQTVTSVTLTRVLNVFPTAAASADPTVGKGPLTVQFSSEGSNDSDGVIVSYEWDFDTDGIIDSTDENPSFTYAPGEYTATLTVTDDSGDSDTHTVEVVSLPNVLPSAVANSDVASGNAPLAVSFQGDDSVDPDGDIVAYSWDFGDGSEPSSEANPTHTYTADGEYSAVLTVTDTDGATASSAVTITVNPNPPPVATINITSFNPANKKVPVTYEFDASGSSDDGSIVSYSWDFGDGSEPGTGVSPSHTYTSVGSFVVTVTVTDNGGLTNTSSTLVSTIANVAPVAVAAVDQPVGKAPHTVNFTSDGSDDPDGVIVAFAWDFDTDGTVDSTEADPTHTYPVGSFVATLAVTDDDGNVSTTTVAVDSLANLPPVAVANAAPSGFKAPLTVAFSSAGSVDNDGEIVGFEWDFEDDGIVDSTDPNPSHVYTTDGLKTARLTLTDDNGDKGTATVQVNVGPENVAPVAVPTATPSSGKRPLTVQFSSDDSFDSDSAIVAYEWDFGDGSEVTNDPNPTHTYGVGEWTATLKVTDEEGLTHTAPITIHSNPPQAPVAHATATPPSGKRPLVVQFSSAGSTDPDDSIVAYAWDFQNDGEVDSTQANPTHTYPQGNWTAKLTVTDEEGLSSSTTVNIASNPNQPPVAVINADRTVSQSPLVVAFDSSSSLDPDDSIVAYQWNFDDGTSSTQPNPTHTFTQPGTYDVTLTVIDQENATGTATVTVTVVTEIQYVSASGDDGNAGTPTSPKRSIGAALAAAAANGQTEVRVAGGSYGSFTVIAGIDVIGGYDQSFEAGGDDGATKVTVTGAANTPGVTVNGATVQTTLKNLTIQGGDGDTAAGATGVLVTNDSDLVLDGVTVDSGTPSAAGSSAYGVRALSGSTVTVKNSTITAQDGVDGTNGTGGATGANGVSGNNATVTTANNTTGTAAGAAVTGTPATRNGGGGGNGGGGNTGSTAQVAGNTAGAAGGGGAAGGAVGASGTSGVGGGGGAGGAAGNAGAPGAAGTNSNIPSDTFVGGAGGTGATGDAGQGGGGGGGGGGANSNTASSRRKGGSGGSGGLGGAGGSGGTGGTAGGGSFGVYSHNASVTVTGTQITTGDGGAGGKGGPGGVGGIGGTGGNGGAPANVNTGVSAAGGGGGGGGAGGTGGSGGGGGAGGPSIGVYSVGTGNQIVSSTTATLGDGGTGGQGGSAGSGGAPGAGGALGAGSAAARNGVAGGAGATRAGNGGNNGAAGVSSARSHSNSAPTASAAFSQANPKGRIPLDVTFSSVGSTDVDGTIVSYSWDFGDGATSNDPNPTHTYTEVGAKTVVLTVTDDEGAVATAQVVVHPTVNQNPTAVANGTPLRGVRPLTVNFSSVGSIDADGTIESYSWDFGDGGSSDEVNPSHVYEEEGFYTATLTVTDDEGGTDQASFVVNARVENVPPVAQAAADPVAGKEPLVVEFSSAGSADVEDDGSIVSYEWEFGDGGTSTSANPKHTYTTPGTYIATLTVTDNDDATHTAVVAITVNANQMPTAQASADVTAGHAPLEVSFDSIGSGDPDGTYELEWDFGDGNTSSAASPTHTYTEQGEYTATLTVTDDNGAKATASLTIDVWAPNQAPAAAIAANPQSGKTPLTVSFDGRGSTDADGTVNSYSWNFDDGGTSSDPTPVHTFTSAGEYEVTLTVTDDDGATGKATVIITVADNVAPTAVAVAEPASGKAIFTTFQFHGGDSTDSDGTIATYSWNFGDGSSASGADQTHIYEAAGTYDVILTVTDDYGDTDTDTIQVVVVDNEAPEAVAGVTPSNGKTGITTFSFSSAGSADSDGSIVGYSWDFGDGSPTSSAANPTKVYFAAGVYDVELTVTDDNGATHTAALVVTVLDNVAPTASPTVNTTTGTTSTGFNFMANAADSDGTVTAYFWAFGDGTFATTANPSNKRYSTPGTYNVTVTVTDNNGAQTTSAPISVTVT